MIASGSAIAIGANYTAGLLTASAMAYSGILVWQRIPGGWSGLLASIGGVAAWGPWLWWMWMLLAQ
jgi:hypothetical protein